MDKISKFIVKNRIIVLIVAILLLIPSLLGYLGTFVNYDILTYLPQNLDSMKGQKYLEEDFEIASTGMLVVENMNTKQTLDLKEKIADIKGVNKVMWVDDIMDVNVPKEMMPDDFRKMFYSDSSTLMLINFDDTTASKSTFSAIKDIKKLMGKECFLGGMSAIVEETKAVADKETPIYVTVAILLALVVLFLGMESYIVPFIFLLCIFFPIAYNFGTNYFLGQISYITNALSTVLQLAVTMDFSIFLLHRYEEEKQNYDNREDAMAKAISATFVSILGSSLTTIAGFLALCTMSLGLGRDIGIVMAKGVVLGVLCTITILPAFIMFFDKPIHKYTHKPIIRELDKCSQFIVKHYKGLIIAFVILVIPFAFAQSQTDVYYNLDRTLPKDMKSIIGTNKLKNDYKMTTTHFITVDENLENYQIKEITDKVEKVKGINSALSYEKYVGGRIPDSFEPEEIKNVLNKAGKKLIVVNSVYSAASDEENEQIDEIIKIIKSYDKNAVVSGEGALTKDLIEVSDKDFRNVNVTSIIAILLIIAICFKSFSIPVLLVAAIESAITINLGIPFFTGTTLPFIAGIVIGTIQLGATVDYAILMTTRFREERRNGLDAKSSILVAIKKCSTSIVTSGLTFFAANIGVCFISKMELIKSLCMLMARGAIISMLVILFALPPILILTDKLIAKTSFGWLKNR